MAGAQTYESKTSVLVPPHRVWEVWCDVPRWPDWTASITSAELLDGATELDTGVRVRIRQPRLPSAVWTVTEFLEGHHFSWESPAPGLRSVATHEVVADGAGSLATARIEQSGPLSGIVRVLMGDLVRRYVALEAAGLKKQSEA
jgi:hypothetical protein